jgi:hypothetical protein
MARSGPGPWFPSRFDSECDECGQPIDEGDRIRADGEGGYVCEPCGEDLDDDGTAS